MKTIKFFAMMVAMMAMCVNFSSCKDDSDPEPKPELPTIVGTSWAYTETANVSGVAVVYDFTISFSATSAVYKIQVTETQGNSSYTDYETVNYSYKLSESGDLVVFTPQETGHAYLEGEIESDMKMVVTNMSTNEFIGIFYKQ